MHKLRLFAKEKALARETVWLLDDKTVTNLSWADSRLTLRIIRGEMSSATQATIYLLRYTKVARVLMAFKWGKATFSCPLHLLTSNQGLSGFTKVVWIIEIYKWMLSCKACFCLNRGIGSGFASRCFLLLGLPKGRTKVKNALRHFFVFSHKSPSGL